MALERRAIFAIRVSLVVAVILAAPVLSHAALLTGMTPSNYSIPSGWGLVRATDFEGSQPSGEEWNVWNASVRTDRPHTGTKSLGGIYGWDQSDVAWRLMPGVVGSYTEVYLSFYEYIESQALFNDEFFLARFNVTDAQGGFLHEVILDWYWALAEDGVTPTYNGAKATLYAVPQGVTFGNLAGKTDTIPKGAWVQWEIHFKPNTPGNSDGFIRIYKDGTLYTSASNANLNGSTSMNNAAIQAGGVYTKLTWMDNYPTCTVCSSAPGSLDYCYSEQGMGQGQLFSSPYCYPTDPSLPSFYRWIDDIIVMKYGGGGVDTDPPILTSRSPDSGETDWPVATETVSFTLYDPSGVDSSTLLVSIIPGGTNFSCASNLSCTPSGDPTSLNVVYDRGSPWAYSTTYTVDITSVYDTQGNQQSTSWQFTTEAYVPSDTTAPTLTSSTPSSGQTGWALNDWQVVFDISDSGNVDDSTLQFNIDGGATQTCGSGLTCSWVIPTTQLRATYNRGSDWSCGKTYTANIPQVKDTTGNTLTTSWNFYTVACPETGPSGDFIIHIHED
jgi:hypothetical protein